MLSLHCALLGLTVVALSAAVAGLPPTPRRAAAAPGEKIQLSEANAINAFGTPLSGGAAGPCAYLLDEQQLSGDPRGGTGGKPKNMWMPGWSKWMYPWMFAIVELPAVYDISSVWMFHASGSNNLTFTFGATPFDGLNPLVVDKADYMAWEGFNVTATGSRYVVIHMNEPTNIVELVLYGTKVGLEEAPDAPPGRAVRAAKPIPFSSFLGVNGFIDDPVARLNCVPNVREYHDWSWDEGEGDPGYPHAQNKFEPNYSGFSVDSFYNATQSAGVQVHECVQGRAPFLDNNNASERGWKPAPDSLIEDRNALAKPESWVALGAHAFQVVARYGSKAVSRDKLQLAAGQAPLTGSGLLKSLEVTNEPNAYWGSGEQYTSPYEYAALLSASYDGHEGSLGPLVGGKTADPGMQMVMGGLAGSGPVSVDYLETMRLWAAHFRKDKTLPTDVLNCHFYCGSDPNPGSHVSAHGLAPEDCAFTETMQNLSDWRNKYFPDKQLWITEFGYDTNQYSVNAALAYGPFDPEQVQGMWLIRSFMASMAAGVDRAHIFMLRDVADEGRGKFMTSGLVTQKGEWTPKASWYYVSTMTQTLKDLAYSSTIIDADHRLYVATLVKHAGHGHDTAARAAEAPTGGFVLWLGSSSGASAKGHVLDISQFSGSDKAVLVQLVGNSTVGLQSALTPQGGKVTVTVSEMPIFVLVGVAPVPPYGPVPPIPAPVPAVCQNLAVGLYCNSTLGNSTYIVCPAGEIKQCIDGEFCHESGPGTIECQPQPSPCEGKQAGLYCDGAPLPAPGWGDEYVLCPSMEKLRCPATQPHCKQNGTTVSCTAAATP